MNPHRSERPKVLFLFSDTGGGHRSAAEAIIESLELLYPNQIETEMVDFFKKLLSRCRWRSPLILPWQK